MQATRSFAHVPVALKAYRRKLWLASEWNYLNIAKDKNYSTWLHWHLFPLKTRHPEN